MQLILVLSPCRQCVRVAARHNREEDLRLAHDHSPVHCMEPLRYAAAVHVRDIYSLSDTFRYVGSAGSYLLARLLALAAFVLCHADDTLIGSNLKHPPRDLTVSVHNIGGRKQSRRTRGRTGFACRPACPLRCSSGSAVGSAVCLRVLAMLWSKAGS